MIKASTTLITFFDDSKLYIGSLLLLLFDNLVILFEVSEWLLNLCTLVGEAQRSRRSWTLEAEENLLALNLSNLINLSIRAIWVVLISRSVLSSNNMSNLRLSKKCSKHRKNGKCYSLSLSKHRTININLMIWVSQKLSTETQRSRSHCNWRYHQCQDIVVVVLVIISQTLIDCGGSSQLYMKLWNQNTSKSIPLVLCLHLSFFWFVHKSMSFWSNIGLSFFELPCRVV